MNNKDNKFQLSKEDQLEECRLVLELERHKGFEILMRDLNKEIQDRYASMVHGTKEKFDENKGYLLGINYVPNSLKGYLNKLRKLEKE